MPTFQEKLKAVDYLFLVLCLVEILYTRSNLSNFFLICFCSIQLLNVKSVIQCTKQPILILYACFIGVGLANLILGYAQYKSAAMIVLTQLFFNLVLMSAVCIYVEKIQLEKLLKIIMLIAVWGSFFELAQHYLRSGNLNVRDLESANSNLMAVYDSCVAVLLLSKIWERKFVLPIVGFLLLFGLLAGTRKAIVSFFLGSAIFYMLSNPQKKGRTITIIVILAAVSFYLLFHVPFIYDTIGYRFESLFDLMKGEKGEASENARLFFIMEGFNAFLDTMWAGHGLDSFRELIGDGSYAHNNYIELLFDLGLPGTIAYYSMHLWLLIKLIKERSGNNSIYINAVIAIIFCILFIDYAMVSYNERLSLLTIIFLNYIYIKDSSKNYSI